MSHVAWPLKTKGRLDVDRLLNETRGFVLTNTYYHTLLRLSLSCPLLFSALPFVELPSLLLLPEPLSGLLIVDSLPTLLLPHQSLQTSGSLLASELLLSRAAHTTTIMQSPRLVQMLEQPLNLLFSLQRLLPSLRHQRKTIKRFRIIHTSLSTQHLDKKPTGVQQDC